MINAVPGLSSNNTTGVSNTPVNSTGFGSAVGASSFTPATSSPLSGGAAIRKPGTGKKSFSPKMILGALVIALLVIGGVAAFVLSQQSQDVRQQASTGNGATGSQCSLTFNATESTSPLVNCVKKIYQDEFSNSAGKYSFNTEKSSFGRGDTLVFKIDVTNTGTASVPVAAQDVLSALGTAPGFTFLDSTCGTGAYDATTKTITCPTANLAPGQTIASAFRIKLSATAAAGSFSNNASVNGVTGASCLANFTVTVPGSPTPTPSVSPSPTPSASPTTYVCGSNCTQDSQCPQNHVCSSGKCALKVCTDGTSSCRADKCSATGCSSSCASNSECPNGHSCNGGVCQLTVCVNNSTACKPDRCSTTSCGTSCNNDSECPSGNVCSSSRCVLKVCTDGSSACRTDKCSTTGCSSSCTSNSECPNGHTCSGNTCKLDACLNGARCNDTQCSVVYTPPVANVVGCNQTCVTNADCQATNHICADTSDGRRCRLEINVNSPTCTVSGSSTTYVPTQSTQPQPSLPPELPKSGSADILKAFFIGLLAVVLGIVGLLLL